MIVREWIVYYVEGHSSRGGPRRWAHAVTAGIDEVDSRLAAEQLVISASGDDRYDTVEVVALGEPRS